MNVIVPITRNHMQIDHWQRKLSVNKFGSAHRILSGRRQLGSYATKKRCIFYVDWSLLETYVDTIRKKIEIWHVRKAGRFWPLTTLVHPRAHSSNRIFKWSLTTITISLSRDQWSPSSTVAPVRSPNHAIVSCQPSRSGPVLGNALEIYHPLHLRTN